MASGRQVEYNLRLNSNASSVLMADSAAANKFDNSMWQVQKTLAAFGLGLGFHYLSDAAKNWTQAAADYETAMLRIRNASAEGFGIMNEKFLNHQVDNFKIKLEEAKDSYGKFLFFVKNTPYSNDQKNQLFENLNIVGKVGGISQENMDATMNNISKLLTEGILEGRTLRNLSRVHPALVPFLAEELGLKSGQKDEFSAIFKNEKIDDETMVQKLSLLISGGKLTKMAISSDALFEAMQKYADSLKSKLPETLNTVQSNLNELENTWYRFKNSLILDQKPELLQLFHDLENSIKWLGEHEEGIIRTGKAIFNLAEAYLAWRVALLAISGLNGGLLGFFTNEQERLNATLGLNKTAIETNTIANEKFAESEVHTAYASSSLEEHYAMQISELDKLKLSLEQVSVQMDLFSTKGLLFSNSEVEMSSAMKTMNEQLLIQNELFTANLGLSSARIAARQTLLDQEGIQYDAKLAAEAGYGGGALARGGVGSFLSGAVVPVMITWIANDVLNAMFPRDKDAWKDSDRTHAFGIDMSSGKYNDLYEDMLAKGYIDMNHPDASGAMAYADPLWVTKDEYARRMAWQSNGTYDPNAMDYRNYIGDIYAGGKEATKPTSKPNLHLPDEHKKLRGNSSNYFSVTIHGGLNGINKLEVREASKEEMENIKEVVGAEITKNMLEIINDIQVVRTGH